jgi:hypothetical protein
MLHDFFTWSIVIPGGSSNALNPSEEAAAALTLSAKYFVKLPTDIVWAAPRSTWFVVPTKALEAAAAGAGLYTTIMVCPPEVTKAT